MRRALIAKKFHYLFDDQVHPSPSPISNIHTTRSQLPNPPGRFSVQVWSDHHTSQPRQYVRSHWDLKGCEDDSSPPVAGVEMVGNQNDPSRIFFKNMLSKFQEQISDQVRVVDVSNQSPVFSLGAKSRSLASPLRIGRADTPGVRRKTTYNCGLWVGTLIILS